MTLAESLSAWKQLRPIIKIIVQRAKHAAWLEGRDAVLDYLQNNTGTWEGAKALQSPYEVEK